MSQLRFVLTLPLSLLVFLVGLNAWAQSPFHYRLGELRQLATQVQAQSQAIEQETRYSYRSGLGLEASELARQADYFRSSLDAYQVDEYQLRRDFDSLVRNYRQVIAYEGSIYGNYRLLRLLGDLRLTMDRLISIFQHQQSASIFAHRKVIELAHRIDHNATALFRSVEQDLGRFGRYGQAEREAVKTLLNLAIAARHLESQVTRLFQDREHTRQDAAEVARRFELAQSELTYLPLSAQSRDALTSLSFDIYEIQNIYGAQGSGHYGPGPGHDHNDPFGRGGSYGPGPGPIPGPGPGYDTGYGPSYDPTYPTRPFDDRSGGYNPCVDPYVCGGGPRGGAPSVRIF